MYYYRKPLNILKDELTQRHEEGFDTSGIEIDENVTIDQLDNWFERLANLPKRADFPYEEPSALAAIRAARPDGPRQLTRPDDLQDKLLGAWAGRAAGCLLGKPVEGLSRTDIETYLRAADAYPLNDYVPLIENAPVKLHQSARRGCTKGTITEFVRDDDIDYTIIGTHILARYGPDFTTANVAETWLHLLPFLQVYTAERVTYFNLVLEKPVEEAATWQNPYREWIGAQIRADGWAYGAAAWPEKAAEFAWRDARLSHVKNGIYGEMWAAAMIAAALAEPTTATPTLDQLEKVVRLGLSEIPANSRLTEAVEQVIAWRRDIDNWETAWERINEAYGHYHWIHTINNAALVALGLLYGDGDYSKSICIAVMGGWDTDCNGATVGSVLGALMGRRNLPSRWIAPMNDRIRSYVIGYDGSSIPALAGQSLHISEQVWA